MSRTLSSREAARYCGVTDKTIRNWVADGKVPAVRGARRLEIDPADLDTYRRPGALHLATAGTHDRSDIAALDQIADVLDHLAPATQQRVVDFLTARYGERGLL